MDGAYDDFAHSGDALQRVDDVRGRVTVQAGGDLVAEQYWRIVQHLHGQGDLFPFAARQKRYARVQKSAHAQRGHDVRHVFVQSRAGHVTVHFQFGLTTDDDSERVTQTRNSKLERSALGFFKLQLLPEGAVSFDGFFVFFFNSRGAN